MRLTRSSRLTRNVLNSLVGRNRALRPAALQLECLESRDLLSSSPASQLFHPIGALATPFGTPGPTGTTPAQVRHAYGFDQISWNGTAGDGSGTTIAIVDAYDAPNITADLHQFDLAFSLPDPVLTKVNQGGGGSPPAADTGWAQEISLDVEWAHAIAPKANILLVEASDASDTNLFAAVQYAARQSGVVAVSMSWGGSEYSGETSSDATFLTPAGHAGVAFIASSGDSGAPTSYPSASPNVLSVGGTTLRLGASGSYQSETAWSGSGGGISAAEVQPAYQRGVVTQSSVWRTNPDVAYDADPNTGFPVYDSYGASGGPWLQFGGTSDAAPQWAALVAIADQGRALQGAGSLDTATQLLPMLYQLPAGDFHDVTSGTTTGTPNYSAGVGYDLTTGRGSPVANLVVAALVGSPSTPAATHFAVSAPATAVAGASFSVTVTALDASGHTVPSYTGTIHFTSSDGQAVLPADAALANGTGTFTVTLRTAGTESVTATSTTASTVNGTASGIAVSPAAAARLVFGQQPTNSVVSALLSPAVTVRLLDAYGNLVSTDNTDTVTLALGANPGGAVLGGTTTVTVTGGVATFGNLSLSKTGTGYTLVASFGTLTGATSAAFNVTASTPPAGTVIENFEGGSSWYVAGGTSPSAYLSTTAAHDGTYGLEDTSGNDWIYRTDAAAQVKPGESISVWLRFAGAADGRAYFGFGASAGGTLSVVAAPNTGQLMLQDNTGFGFTTLAAVNQAFQANHWYRLEADWGAGGALTGRLFDSNGLTLLNSVSAVDLAFAAGGIAFRATGHDKLWDTVTVSQLASPSLVPLPTSVLPVGATAAGWTQPPPVRPAGAYIPPAGIDRFVVMAGPEGATFPVRAAARAVEHAGEEWLASLFSRL